MFKNCKIAGRGVNSDEYHAMKDKIKRGDPAFVMSPSALNLFASVPPSKWIKGYERKETGAKTWGNVLDTVDLTPEQFGSKYVVEPETYRSSVMVCPSCGDESPNAKSCRPCGEDREEKPVDKPWNYLSKDRRAWREKHRASGREPISFEMNANAQAARDRLFEVGEDGDDVIKRWFEDCDKQVLLTGEWQDPETELIIPVSALLDFEPRKDSEFRNCLGDLKSTNNAQPFVFSQQAFKLGYHRQAAFDLDLYNAATGESRNTWAFIIQENYEPWEVNRAMYGDDGTGLPSFIDLGRDYQYGGYEMALAHYCKCLKTGRWLKYNEISPTTQGWCILRPIPKNAEQAMFGVNLSFGDGEFEDPDWVKGEEKEEGVPF